jgi:4-hydroxy-tetrahydrodipicolinate reductase
MTALRVVQWATGNIGARSLRAVIEHPALDLAGVYVHSDDKAGRDAGDLCGLGPTGVVATRDAGSIVGLGADCVLYMPRACHMDEVCLLLASGANVVTTRGEFHHPAGMDPEVRARVEAACAAGGSSIHSTGSSPGFITEAVPLVLTSIQRRLDGLTIDEFADLSQRDSPGLLFEVMGFGRPPADLDEGRLSHGRTSFGPSLALLADALGLPLDGVEASGAVATAARPVEIAAGTLEAGTVAAQRVIVTGVHGGRPLLRFQATWYCTPDLDPAWEVRRTGWRVRVDGDAPLDVDLPFPVTLEDMAATTPGYTANRAVNAVPVVCAAPPGIRTTVDLPQVIARLG